jgi:hypothetical protein
MLLREGLQPTTARAKPKPLTPTIITENTVADIAALVTAGLLTLARATLVTLCGGMLNVMHRFASAAAAFISCRSACRAD